MDESLQYKLYFILFVYMFSIFVASDNGRDYSTYFAPRDDDARRSILILLFFFAVSAFATYKLHPTAYSYIPLFFVAWLFFVLIHAFNYQRKRAQS
jgi:hypothetical protein